MTYKLKKKTASKKLFKYENLTWRKHLSITLLYLHSEVIFETICRIFAELLVPIFLEMYIKMGEKRPFVEANSC